MRSLVKRTATNRPLTVASKVVAGIDARYVFTQDADQVVKAYETAAVEGGWVLGAQGDGSDGLCATRMVGGHRQHLGVVLSNTSLPPEHFFWVILNADDSPHLADC